MKESKNTDIKKLFLSIGIFTIVCFCLDFVIGTILNKLYFKQQSGLQYRTTYAIEKTNAEVIVLGSSRANHHYVPAVFENILHYSFYNAGKDGSSIFYNYAILKGILKRYKPRIIVLEILKEELGFEKEWYDRLSELLPYYATHPEIRSIILLKSRSERLKLISKIYPYNSSLLTILIGNTELNKKRRMDLEGYVPLFKTYKGSLFNPKDNFKDPIDTLIHTK
ncbi:MAG TPA: hypothetical protein VIJ75_11955 [Hanamia sp.]